MKLSKLKRRLSPKRPMTAISLRIPADVIEDLKRVAPVRGFSGYQSLMRAYIGQGLRVDMERLDNDPSTLDALISSLRRHGISRRLLDSAVAEAQLQRERA